LVTEPDPFPGGITKVLHDRLARFEIGPQETVSAGLGRLGYAASDVRLEDRLTQHSALPGRLSRGTIEHRAFRSPKLALTGSGRDPSPGAWKAAPVGWRRP